MKISKRILGLFLFLIIAAALQAQVDVKIKKVVFKKQLQGFEDAWMSVKVGNKLFRYSKSTYREAIDEYLKAYKYNNQCAELNYKIGVCYLYSDNKQEAARYLEEAYKLNNFVTWDIQLQLGRAYQMRYEFDPAMDSYSAFKSTVSSKKLLKLQREGIDPSRYMEECESGKELMERPVKAIVSNAGDGVNSAWDDYRPLLIGNDSIMYFTSRRRIEEKSKRIKFDKKFDEDIYKVEKVEKEWGSAQLLPEPLNTKRNDALMGIENENRLIIYSGKKGKGNIYIKEFVDGKWKKNNFFKRINTKYFEGSVWMNKTQDTAYVVSNHFTSSYGGTDIYMSTRDEKGRWVTYNMGNTINTKYNEEAVFMHPDGRLYFSSKGHNTMGGYDVFYTKRDSAGEWMKPVNVGYPVNSPDDDLFYQLSENKKSAYVSSIRKETKGERDIYRVVFLGADKEPFMTGDNDLLAYFKYDKPNIFKKAVETLDVDSTSVMRGKILDAKTKQPVKELTKMNLIDSQKSQIIASCVSDTAGNYKLKVPEKKKLGVEISAKGYLFFLEVIDLTNEKEDLIVRNFEITKIEVGQKVVLNNIFFETNKTKLKPASISELERVLKLMTDNPDLKLEISGHTDNVGALKKNQVLSKGRAKTVVDWLVSKGVSESRLTSEGYAFSQPVDTNKTPKGRAKNRRVEFKVLGN